MSQAKVMQPLVVTDAMLVDSSLFETAPATYAAGTTYALGAYASVAGALGEILIYKSLQAGNIGHTPASSPTWWVYSSSTYGVYNPLTTYAVAHRVVDTLTHTVKESVFSGNLGFPIDNTSSWLAIDAAGRYDQTLPFYVGATTYAAGAVVISDQASAGDPSHMTWPVYKSKASGNVGHGPDVSPAYWQFVGNSSPIYAPEATYALGEVVSDGKGNYYECLFASTKGKPLTGKLAWQEVSPSNRTAMFDKQTQTASTGNKEISFTIASGIIDAVGLIGVNADLAVVTVRDGLGGAVVFTKTVGLTGGNPTNAWDYYFTEPTLRTTQCIIDGIPPYVNSHVTIKLTGGGAIGVGNVIIGKNKDIGLAEFGLTAGIIDFSVKTTNEFGVSIFVKRGFKKKVNVRTFVNNSKLNLLQNLLYSLRAEPCLWQFSDAPKLSEAVVLYGFYKDFSTAIPYPTNSYVNLEIEGLI